MASARQRRDLERFRLHRWRRRVQLQLQFDAHRHAHDKYSGHRGADSHANRRPDRDGHTYADAAGRHGDPDPDAHARRPDQHADKYPDPDAEPARAERPDRDGSVRASGQPGVDQQHQHCYGHQDLSFDGRYELRSASDGGRDRHYI
jgi:hypothetical protein